MVQAVVAEVRAVFDEHFEAANRAKTVHRRRRNGENERILNACELLIQRTRNGGSAQVRRFPLLKGLQTEENNPGVGRDTEAADAQPRKRDRVLHTWLLQADIRHSPNH